MSYAAPAWSTPTVGDESKQAEGASTMDNQARNEFHEYFLRLLDEVEASRSTDTRDQLKERLNRLWDEMKVIARELAISAEDCGESEHYGNLVLEATNGFTEKCAEMEVIKTIRGRESGDYDSVPAREEEGEGVGR
jgi:hypothetical protein